MEASESRRLQNPDAAESQVNMNDVENRSSSAQHPNNPALIDLCEDVKTEEWRSSYGGRSNSEELDPPEETQSEDDEEIQKKIIKEEDVDEEDYYLYGGMSNFVDQHNEEEEAEDEDFLYCELCKSFFINKCELHGPALFIPDTPVPMGFPDRAPKTLPAGLEVQKSGVPDAGLGVFNKGQTLPVGAHFGPYQGDLVEREEAMNSGYSWVLYRSRKCEEYIDAKREMNANWMRYVNCARNDEEKNLVAFQYGGGILYRSCRPIEPGQELLVWYEEEYAKDLSITFHHIWNRKSSADGMNDSLLEEFLCPLCPLSYTSQIYLHKHIERCHIRSCYVRLLKLGESKLHHQHPQSYKGKKPCVCSQCGKIFTRYSALQCHKRLHTGEKPYHCSQCGKRFTQKGNLQQHQRIHTGEKPYPCLQCGKTFSLQSNLHKHQRVHTGEKPHVCLQCGKSFTLHSHLQRHVRIHTGEKPYHCSQCGKSFAQQSHLQVHQRMHTGEKPYYCTQCKKSFNRQSNFLQHQRIHTGDKPYPCVQCGKSFTKKRYLHNHQRLHTEETPLLQTAL